ncbi:hypothetical protein K9L27_03020 [Candidatus Gracilibacteria bacterium]|nr:hypothetical protein [Candidatus Gracilibacteria bacterium]
MGGGSSNFATSVQLLHDLFGLGKVPAELVTQSAKYGKDIPFFFSHQTCLLSEGFGEVLSPLPFDFHNKKLILYSPPFSSSTVEAYARLKNLNTSFTERFLAQPTLNNIGNSFDEMFSLEMYQKLSSQFTGFHITGSGSCFWGLEKNDFRNCEIIETRFL